MSEVEEHIRGFKSKGVEVGKLMHTPGLENPADLATRGLASLRDVDRNSEWQNGPAYLTLPRSQWHVSREFREKKKERICGANSAARILSLLSCNKESGERVASLTVATVTDKMGPEEVKFLGVVRTLMAKSSRYNVVRGTVARLIAASVTGLRETILLPPSSLHLRQARYIMELSSMTETRQAVATGRLSGLPTFTKNGLVVTRGRLGDGLSRVLGVSELTVLMPHSPLSKLLMVRAHKEDHRSYKITLWRSRAYIWIVRGKKLATEVVRECQLCLIKKKVGAEQQMGDIGEDAVTPGWPWHSIALDLMGPVKIKLMVKSRAEMKVWPLVIVCRRTGAVHTEVMAKYGAADFLLAYAHFTARRGTPSKVTSDRGSQLTAAAAYVTWTAQESPTSWDWDSIVQQTAAETEWKFVLAGCQWWNGLAESRVKILKATLQHTVAQTSLNFAELQVVLARAADIANNRPVGVKCLNESDVQALTPNMLLLGRTSTVGNEMINKEEEEDEEGAAQVLPGRLAYMEELLDAWWAQWNRQVFPNLVPHQDYKKAKRHTNLEVGDICLLRYDGRIKDTYRMCRIAAVKEDEHGVVRTVEVQMRPRDSRDALLPYRSKQPILQQTGVQRLVLIVPAEQVKQLFDDQQHSSTQQVSSL